MSKSFPRKLEQGGVVLSLSPDEVYVEFVPGTPSASIRRVLRAFDLRPVREGEGALGGSTLPDVLPQQQWVRTARGELEDVIDRLLGSPQVQTASPVYHRRDILPLRAAFSFGDNLLVRFPPGIDDAELKDGFDDVVLEDVTGDAATLKSEVRRVRVRRAVTPSRSVDGNAERKVSPLEILEIARRLEAVAAAEARPDWLQLTRAICQSPDDPYFMQQWHLERTGWPAWWDLSTRPGSVAIAILDTGCDLGHEDLLPRYVSPAQWRDVVSGNGMPHDGTGHGTCCAGLVAAEANNNLGVAGVAWDCQIMPIRMIDGMKIRSELNLVAALDWARLHGARVASMSWRWLGPRSFFDAAITAAHTAGMVLVAAAGNGGVRMIDYPASHPLVMAVGATDMQDQRKTTSSPDREQWGSQYGSGLSVMAPGVACWTTDLTGTAGFNKNNGGTVTFGGVTHDHSGSPDGKYFAWMNGTSAAAPQLAGLAGLLMSERPSLSPEEVRRAIESTCGKVGGYPYAVVPGNPNGTWHEEMGYGRIDILSCMQIHAPRAASPASALIA